jgi:hypothetical protein
MPPKPRPSLRVLYLGVTIVFWLTVIGLVIGIPVGLAITVFGDKPMSVHATVPAQALTGLPAHVVSDGVEVSVPIDHLTTAQIVVFHTLITLGGLLILYALWQLRRLVGSIRAGDPFSADNVRRLRVLGWLLLAAYPVFQYVTGGVNEWILSTGAPDIAGARVEVDPFSIGAVFGGLVLLVLAEVFGHGLSLREDVEATI